MRSGKLQSLEKIHKVTFFLLRQVHLESVIIEVDDLIQRRCGSVMKIRSACRQTAQNRPFPATNIRA